MGKYTTDRRFFSDTQNQIIRSVNTMNRPFIHQEVPVTIRTLQAVGITAAAFLASPPPLLIKQWKKSFEISTGIEGFSALALGGIFSYLAYREPSGSTSAFKLYTTAAVLLPAAIPYTILLMKPINSKLLSKANSLAAATITDAAVETGVAKEETTHALVDKWATLHLGRALLAATAAVSAAWATISAVDVIGFEKIGLTTGADRLS